MSGKLENKVAVITGGTTGIGFAAAQRFLDEGARIVITGRIADASLVVAPAVFEFGWRWDDWDLLSAATTAGSRGARRP